MPLSDRDAGYLWDMLDAARMVNTYVKELSLDQYLAGRKLQLTIRRHPLPFQQRLHPPKVISMGRRIDHVIKLTGIGSQMIQIVHPGPAGPGGVSS